MSDDRTHDMPDWTMSANERQPESEQDIERARRLADDVEDSSAGSVDVDDDVDDPNSD